MMYVRVIPSALNPRRAMRVLASFHLAGLALAGDPVSTPPSYHSDNMLTAGFHRRGEKHPEKGLEAAIIGYDDIQSPVFKKFGPRGGMTDPRQRQRFDGTKLYEPEDPSRTQVTSGSFVAKVQRTVTPHLGAEATEWRDVRGGEGGQNHKEQRMF